MKNMMDGLLLNTPPDLNELKLYFFCLIENRLFNLFYPQLDRLDIYTDWKTYTDTDKTGYMIVCQCAKQ